jgi:hypothetical protein
MKVLDGAEPGYVPTVSVTEAVTVIKPQTSC